MSQVPLTNPLQFWQNPSSWLYNFWKFSRPHTIIGTSGSVFALFVIAISTTNSQLTAYNITQAIGVWLACILGNIYIVGLNQLEDIAIDQINKPHLPLASGEFSLKTGQTIVIITGIFSLIFALFLGQWLLATVGFSLFLGTAYSLPPLRLKKFPFWAAFCIFTVRGVIVNLGLFLHFSQILSGQAFLPLSVWLLTLFVLIFTVAIAIFKDVPDLEGDRQYQITTFTLILGQEKILKIALGIISFCYLGMIIAGFFKVPNINPYILIVAHLVLLIILWMRSRGVNLKEKKEITQFYQFIWKLFFIEYIIFPVACVFR
ncbi:homogentisate phytyltransferase [Aphanothece hegewaldii CCALA 016]|uniref:Homogentisate phytyltransferase n=1 Tax=Aphanothece hegewaldii CCALA 016 TaxID=2107694 RepID=A0A2T1M3Z6_9CHRO|nr:homogentisate phytyltransferase [Aphanothece hegewaldii]PSF39536.1 homogentisate phytyltransferase [Aphanothece hegewaldii CCALA 016]